MAAETTAAPPTLVVHASHVPGGGWGLFTTAPIPAGTEVVEYRGTPLRTAAAVAAGRDKAYLMRLGPQAYTDGREHAGMLARYMNDARAVRYNNVYFDKRPEAGCAVAIALRDIDAGAVCANFRIRRPPHRPCACRRGAPSQLREVVLDESAGRRAGAARRVAYWHALASAPGAA